MALPRPVGDYDTVQAMHRYGGHFVRALAAAIDRADADNFTRIKAAFPELWAEYRRMAQHDHDAPRQESHADGKN